MKLTKIFESISEFSESKKGLYFILLVSLLIKILTLIIMQEMAINRDGTQYIAAAQQFAQGNFSKGIAFHPMPFYSFIITIVHFVIPNWLIAARIISILSLVLAVIPLYLITAEMFNKKAAFWACLAFTLSPEPSQLAMEVLRDPVFLLCLLWAVYFAQRAIQKKEVLFFSIAAVFLWVPLLFRIEGIIFAPYYIFYLACLFSIAWFTSQEKTPYLKALLISFGVVFIGAVSFWIILAPDSINFNKINSVVNEVRKIFNFGLGKNYTKIYDHLKSMEELALYSSGNQNFAEVARHFIFVIYLIGLLELLVKSMFVFYVVPFIWGLRSSMSRARAFLLGFVGCYIFVLFYTYVERDFLQTRFLLPPAILLYPWIGYGFQQIFLKIKSVSHPRLVLVICCTFFLVMPLGKYIRSMAHEDRSMVQTGEWLQSNDAFKHISFYTNDSRIAFHSGKSRSEFEKYAIRYKEMKRKHGTTLEQFAIKNKIDLIALKTSKKKNKPAPKFKRYRKIKEIEGKKRVVIIYCSQALCENIKP